MRVLLVFFAVQFRFHGTVNSSRVSQEHDVKTTFA